MTVHIKWKCLIPILSSLHGQELLVSGLKRLEISHRSIQVIKSQPYLGSFQNTLSE